MSFGKVKQNIVVLSISNLIIGLIEFVFNMYLSRIFGAEGLGLLSLITPINCIFLSFMTEGIVVTMSKISAKQDHFGDYPAMISGIKITTVFSFLWSLVLVLIIMITAKPIATYFLDEPSLVYPILATCPLMLLMSISNILKGHFLGLAKIRIPATINICEKLLRFPILYLLIRFLLCKGSFPPVTLVYLCYALGEIQSVLLLEIYYKVTKPKIKPNKINQRTIHDTLHPMIKGATPICFTQCLFEFANAFSTVIVKSRLLSIGYTSQDALSLLGMYRGMVFPLMDYPMILIGAACSIVVPKISTLIATGKAQYSDRLIKRALLLSFVIGIITMVIFIILGDQMGAFFYKRNDLEHMIRMAGLCAPLLYVTVTTSSLLIGIGEESLSFRHSLLQQLVLLIGLVIFTGIPELNIYGYFIAIVISDIVLLVMNLSSLSQKSHKEK